MLPGLTEQAPAARLCVLGPSHYCERARWALDHAGLTYAEERWAVGLHAVRARRIAPGTSLPILVLPGEVVQGSGAILDQCGLAGGLPDLERWLADRVGPLVRRYLYAGLLNDPGSGIRDVLLEGAAPGEAALARFVWPATRRMMIAGMGARAERLPELGGRLSDTLARFERRLGSRPHLAGDAFGRADLTAASLLSPLLRPPVIDAHRRVRMPPDMEAALARWGKTAALRWVRRIYGEHRHRRGV